MRLMPGLYSINIVVKDRDRSVVDTILGVRFSVENISVDNEKLFGLGYVYVETDWTPPQKIG